MGPAGDQVQRLRVTLHDRRQRLDRHLESLPGRDQAEGGQQEALLHPLVSARHRRHVERAPSGGLLLAAPCELHRRAVRHDSDLVGRARADLGEQPPCRVGHHDRELCLIAESGEHLELMRRGLRQHRVQGHDERLGQLLGEGQHVLAVGAAEDPVLVLEQDDVDVEPADEPGRAHVVPANRLRDGGQQLGPLRARRLVDDHDRADAIDAREREQRRSHVEREGADATCTRRIRREDRGTHASGAPLSRTSPR